MKKNTKQLLFERMHSIGGMPLNENMLNEITTAQAKDKFYKNIDNNIYNELIQADPTYNKEKDIFGKYSKWILQQYLNKNFKDEDIYKINDYLTAFDKYKSKIQQKDINQYKTPVELFKSIEPFTNKEKDGDESIMSNKELSTKIKSNEAKKVYEDNDWTVIVPETERASCYYGKGTQWCTAATNGNNMFDHYHEQGDLYIIINKQNPDEKYQFHFESSQFMDVHDSEIDAIAFLDDYDNQNLKQFFMNNATPESFTADINGSSLNVVKENDKYYIRFDELSEFKPLFIDDNFIDVDVDDIDVNDYIYSINDTNKNTIENITNKPADDVLDSIYHIEDDYDDYDDIVYSIRNALYNAKISGNIYSMFELLYDNFNVDADNRNYLDYDEIKNIEYYYNLEIEIPFDTYFKLNLMNGNSDEFLIVYNINGQINNLVFNENLSKELDENF